ncbi:hypothetical protein VM1G_10808 [Cytospora mali]|uniref:HNH nuclease domain-containing protein n=1 Tax=Cytospora mali TaxID=578113 RepID=A0A194VIS1_CYTMA|nr:hypothetical protein VM1G_10808 [Valsa mali]
MAVLTIEERSYSRNIYFWAINAYGDSAVIAGVYQRDNLLSVLDVVHELEVCFTFGNHGDNTTRQPAFLYRGPERYRLIILDRENDAPFPTPPSEEAVHYEYVFHHSCCTQDLHSLNDSCIVQANSPMRRVDPRYMEIGESSQDPRLSVAPLRKIQAVKRRSESISTASPTASSSPAKSISAEEPIPNAILVQPEKARAAIENFRPNVIVHSSVCALSGKGKFWAPNKTVGPGVEAAHIVLQIHWHTYPLSQSNYVANKDNSQQLQDAWLSTWGAGNGIPLQSNLHKCFDARIVSIHPETHRIRAFVNYDILTDYHGNKAIVPDKVDKKALRYHWDMCCLENTPEPSTGFPVASVFDNVPNLPPPFPNRDTPQGHHHSQGPLQTASDTEATSNTQATSDTQAFHTHASRPTQSSTHDAHPPSPPPSEPAPEGHEIIKESGGSNKGESISTLPGERRTIWRFVDEIIKDPDTAQRMMDDGWRLEPINNDEVYGRGRSREKRPCVRSEEAAEDDRRKRQRYEPSPDVGRTGL